MNTFLKRIVKTTTPYKRQFVIAFSHTTSKRDAKIAQLFFDISTQRAHDVREQMRSCVERYAIRDDIDASLKRQCVSCIAYLKRDTIDIVRHGSCRELRGLRRIVVASKNEHMLNAYDDFIEIIV